MPPASLNVRSNFTFLGGASHPDELVERASLLGHAVACIADVNSLAGVVRGHLAAKQVGIPFAVGTYLVVRGVTASTNSERKEGTEGAGAATPLTLLAYPGDRAAYGRLCRLLTIGKRRAPKGECHLALEDVLEHAEGMLLVLMPPAGTVRRLERWMAGDGAPALAALREACGNRLSLGLDACHGAEDRARQHRLIDWAAQRNIAVAACDEVRYHDRSRRQLHDVLTCIRERCTIAEAGRRLLPNGECSLRTPAEIAALFAVSPAAVERSTAIALAASGGFSLDELRYQYPDEVVPPDTTPMLHLRALAEAGGRERYPQGMPPKVRRLLDHEYALIEELGYARYFLTVEDICRFARSRGILHQGRGAAANSVVCYCLGVTSVDPDRIDVLFERFISRERDEPPDIDIDFEHERREEVIQYLYRKYGRDRAALTAEVISYRSRSAVREVGKALGLSLDLVDRLAKDLDWWHGVDGEQGPIAPEKLRAHGVNPNDPLIAQLVRLSREIVGFPRHLSQHVGGFVITQGPLSDLVPVENAAMADRTVIEWDKDDIDAMGMLKVDVLGLGMLSAIAKAIAMVNDDPRRTNEPLSFRTVPPEDPAVYDMICAADTVGVFQIESRAQMSMLPRLRPRCFYDLVIEVAIVRPGPIQGQMVHPYLRRRNGLEPVVFPDDAVRRVLGKTLGIPLFQEQAMSLAMVAAGFSAGEADQLRRAIAAWKTRGNKIAIFGEKIIGGMIARGYDQAFAEQVFTQIKGFSGYGFPESHAASFSLLVYVSAWLKRHHPAAFAAALINSQPMGFYAPAQLVRDAREHGVEVRAVDVAQSAWDCTLEPGSSANPTSSPALRLGLRLVRGLSQEDGERIAAAVREHGPFRTIEALHRTSNVRVAALRCLARADAFGSLDLSRQHAIWKIQAIRDERMPLFEEGLGIRDQEPGSEAALPAGSPISAVALDYEHVGLSLRAHPLSFSREELARRGAITTARMRDESFVPNGTRVLIAGLVLVRQRPSTAKGIVFMTIEDETGSANLIIRPDIWARDRRAAKHSVAILARGTVERQSGVINVVVKRIESLTVGGGTRPARNFR